MEITNGGASDNRCSGQRESNQKRIPKSPPARRGKGWRLPDNLVQDLFTIT
jgi:hypothetical protein